MEDLATYWTGLWFDDDFFWEIVLTSVMKLMTAFTERLQIEYIVIAPILVAMMHQYGSGPASLAEFPIVLKGNGSKAGGCLSSLPARATGTRSGRVLLVVPLLALSIPYFLAQVASFS